MKSRIVILALACLCVPVGASGGPRASAVGTEPSVAVIDVYLNGIEAPATGDYGKAVAKALSGSGYAVLDRDEVATRFRSVLIMPVRRMQEDRLADVERLVRDGDQLVYTDPKAAVEVLNKARSQLESLSDGLSANDRLRDEFLKTQMLLARSHLDSGNEARAGEVLREVLRTFGDDLDVSERDYHPRLVKLFQKVKAGMRADRTASLSVQTPDPGCVVLLDGRPQEGETPREYKNLYPGVHYVQVRCGAGESMVRRVTLGKDKVHLLVDVAFEKALAVDAGRLGLVFDDARTAQARMVPFAAKFGELVGADLVVVQGFLEDGSRSDLKGLMIDTKKGTQIRAASVPARSSVVTPSSVKAMVDLLVSDAGEAGTAASQGAAAGTGSGGKAWYQNYYGWILTAVGVGGLAWGGAETAIYLGHRSKAQKAYPAQGALSNADYLAVLLKQNAQMRKEATLANTASTYAIVGYSVGGAALVGGVVLFALTDKIWPGAEAPRAMLLPTVGSGGGGMMLSMPF